MAKFDQAKFDELTNAAAGAFSDAAKDLDKAFMSVGRERLVAELRENARVWAGDVWADTDTEAADLLEADAAELARCTVMIAERDNRIEILERAASVATDTQIDYEVWQDGMMVAGSSDLPDARHYVMMYEQDGPCEIIVATTTRVPLSAAPQHE